LTCWLWKAGPTFAVAVGLFALASLRRRQQDAAARRRSPRGVRAAGVNLRSKDGYCEGHTPEHSPKFLNDALRMLWPHISAHFAEVLEGSVQAAVQQALPSRLNGQVVFEKELCHLGNQPLSFRSINVSRTSQSTFRGEVENLSMRADFDWEGDCSVKLRCAGVGIGIHSFAIKGSLIIELVWLCSEPPMFKGVRAFLLDTPGVHFDWQGAAKVDFLGILKRTILQTISSQISERLVVPNMVGMALQEDADIFAIRNPRPAGLLKLTVHSAEELIAVDPDLLGGASTSDPFFELHCGAQRARSATHYKTLAPTFDHTVPLLVNSVEEQKVRITFYDENTLSARHFLGFLELGVVDAAAWGRKRHACELADAAGKTGSSGRVWLSAEWRPLLMDNVPKTAEHDCFAFAGLYAAGGVPVLGLGAEHWVTADCSHLLVFSPLSPMQETARLADSGECRERMDAEVGRAKEKFRMMKAYGMPVEDIAKVLELDREVLLRLMRPAELPSVELASPDVANGVQKLRFQHAFEFLISDPAAAMMTFMLMRSAPGMDSFAPDVCSVDLASLLTAPKHTLKRTLWTKDGAQLDFLFQLRFFTAPTDEVWFDVQD